MNVEYITLSDQEQAVEAVRMMQSVFYEGLAVNDGVLPNYEDEVWALLDKGIAAEKWILALDLSEGAP